MSGRIRVSAAEARRIALAAQGFGRARPKSPNDVRHFRRALSAITVLQLDFVNVLVPAHFLMIWSRLGAYERDRFENYLYDSGEYIEQWAHEASVVAASDWSLLAHRRAAYGVTRNSPLQELPNCKAYLQNILRQVEEQGETISHDLPKIRGPARKPGDWYRSIPRRAIEHHFATGRLAVRRRQKNFQRVYDLPERILDDCYCSATVPRVDAERELIRKATVALGIATLADIADYYRMKSRDALPRIQELVEDGVVSELQVEGWVETAYLSACAVSPRSIPGASLLSPFDPVVWYRPRALRLFDFDYRIEIYVPAAKRRWGYYVLPFRQADSITARVDLKADRKASRLLVQNAHLEACADATTSEALINELRAVAEWLELDSIVIQKTNAFEKALAASI